MEKPPFSDNVKQWLTPFIKQVLTSPEFCMKEGTLAQRLEHAYYYNMGGLQQPAHVTVSEFLKLLEKLDIKIVVQDLKIHIMIAPVYEISADVAIMAQDVYRVFGAGGVDNSDEDSSESVSEIVEQLANYQPKKTGEIYVHSPSWCKSRHLLEAIVYEFEQDDITSEEIVRTALKKCFKKSCEFQPKKIAIDALGTESSGISATTFAVILVEALQESAAKFSKLKELIISAKNEEQVEQLKDALFQVLENNPLDDSDF